MKEHPLDLLELAAEGFCYPSPGQIERLETGLALLLEGSEKHSIESFVKKMSCLRLSEREELYTRTLDLNPPAAPYVGFQIWGESYERGIFLSKLNRALIEAGIDTEGELPDHLIPVLRYLGQAADPLPELLEALLPALRRIHDVLRQADSTNPFLDILEAVQAYCKNMVKETA